MNTLLQRLLPTNDAPYWRWWSDAIIHRIHERVLTHLRTLSESQASSAVSNSASGS